MVGYPFRLQGNSFSAIINTLHQKPSRWTSVGLIWWPSKEMCEKLCMMHGVALPKPVALNDAPFSRPGITVETSCEFAPWCLLRLPSSFSLSSSSSCMAHGASRLRRGDLIWHGPCLNNKCLPPVLSPLRPSSLPVRLNTMEMRAPLFGLFLNRASFQLTQSSGWVCMFVMKTGFWFNQSINSIYIQFIYFKLECVPSTEATHPLFIPFFNLHPPPNSQLILCNSKACRHEGSLPKRCVSATRHGYERMASMSPRQPRRLAKR